MKKLYHLVSNIGIDDEMSADLRQKVALTNIIAMVIGVGMALPFVVISIIHFKEIAFIPAIAVFVSFLILGLNAARIDLLSRLLTAILPFSLVIVYNAYLMPAGQPLLFELYCLAMSFVIVPFLVFDVNDKQLLIFCYLFITGTLIFLIEPLNKFLEADLDITVVTDGYLGILNIILSTIFMFGIIMVLAYQNVAYKEKSEALVKEMDKRNDELTQSQQKLEDNINEIESKQEEEKKRNWASEGIAQFNNLLRSNMSSQELFEQIVYDLTKYIKANQCWLFLTNDDNDDVKLELKACYAYDRHKYLEKTIESGQGLLGQAFLEKKHIYLKEVPEDYVNITSGLGKAPPRSILIVPLIVNEEVQGLFEIASFNLYEEYEIQFVQDLGETIASFISVNKINEKTKYLLEESQQQAEEMKSQEEEMRQNMEELAATQEEMQRKEQEYVNRIKELEDKLGQEA